MNVKLYFLHLKTLKKHEIIIISKINQPILEVSFIKSIVLLI